MSTLKLPMSGRTVAAALTAWAAVAMACVPAAAASASGAGRSVRSAPVQISQAASAWTDGSLCLTNARSSCASVQLGTADNAVLGNDTVSRMVVDTNQDGYWEA